MAEEDAAREELIRALQRVNRIPRPSIRKKILWETMHVCAESLGMRLEGEK